MHLKLGLLCISAHCLAMGVYCFLVYTARKAAPESAAPDMCKG